jgi:hypothetical protein
MIMNFQPVQKPPQTPQTRPKTHPDRDCNAGQSEGLRLEIACLAQKTLHLLVLHGFRVH